MDSWSHPARKVLVIDAALLFTIFIVDHFLQVIVVHVFIVPEVTKYVLNSNEAIVVSVKVKESFTNCFILVTKFLFYHSFHNFQPILNDNRLFLLVFPQLLFYFSCFFICLALSIILDKVQMGEKSFFKQI